MKRSVNLNSDKLKIKVNKKEERDVKHSAICSQCPKHNDCNIAKVDCDYWVARVLQ